MTGAVSGLASTTVRRLFARAMASKRNLDSATTTPTTTTRHASKRTKGNQVSSSFNPQAPDDVGTARLYLLKSEPDEFSIKDLKDSPQGTAPWDGVRNAQARNILREMRVGDRAFFYHSSCRVPAIVGIVKVVREAYPAREAAAGGMGG